MAVVGIQHGLKTIQLSGLVFRVAFVGRVVGFGVLVFVRIVFVLGRRDVQHVCVVGVEADELRRYDALELRPVVRVAELQMLVVKRVDDLNRREVLMLDCNNVKEDEVF